MPGGADWNTPTAGTGYIAVLTNLNDKDVDAITLQKTAPSNLPVGAIAWDRANLKFKEWSGAAFIDMVLSITGGGTSSASAAGARTALGLGSMSTQNSNGVAITGGTISGVTMDAGVITSGVVALARGGTGVSLAIGASGQILQVVAGALAFVTPNFSGVIQTVIANTPTAYNVVLGATYNDVTSHQVSITPTSISNRVRLTFTFNYFMSYNAAPATRLDVRILRGAATQVLEFKDVGGMLLPAGGIHIGSGHLDIIDSPATLAATTYKLQARYSGAGAGETVQINTSTASTMIAQETV